MTSTLELALQLMVKYTGNDLYKFVCKVLLGAPVLKSSGKGKGRVELQL